MHVALSFSSNIIASILWTPNRRARCPSLSSSQLGRKKQFISLPFSSCCSVHAIASSTISFSVDLQRMRISGLCLKKASAGMTWKTILCRRKTGAGRLDAMKQSKGRLYEFVSKVVDASVLLCAARSHTGGQTGSSFALIGRHTPMKVAGLMSHYSRLPPTYGTAARTRS